MKKSASIRTRITLWYVIIMTVSFLCIMAIVWGVSYELSMESIETDLKLQTNSISNQIRTMVTKSLYAAVATREENKNIAIYHQNGELIVGQHNIDGSYLDFADGVLRRETIDGKEYFIYDVLKMPSRDTDNDGYWVRGAISIDNTSIFYKNQIIILLAIFPIMLLVATCGGWYISKKAFDPVDRIVKTANSIYSENDIKQRIPTENARKDEIYDLSVTLNQMLERIDNTIMQEKQFTSDASHELRTPVSVILAQGEYLLDIADDEKERELAEDIVCEAKRLTNLVSKLLMLSRMDNKRQMLNKAEIDPQELIECIVFAMRELAERKNINLITNVNCSSVVTVDEDLFVSALSNLVSNSIKYTNENGSVIISAVESENNVEFSVKDTGIGIAPENIEKIWTRFYKVDETRNNEDGSYGLGLSLVKSIVDLHDAEISVQSVLGEGTEFTVTLKK